MDNQHHKHDQKRRVSLQKYYQIWEGRNVLLCKGKFMIGASIQPVIYTLMLINIPAFLEEFLIIRLLNGAVFAGTLIPYIVLHVLGNVFMFRTILTDPGIIRRYNEKYVDSEELSHIPQRKLHMNAKRPCEITLSNHLMKFKYCRTCHIYRPPRATHCHECDNCVERFDHHCPWLGVCIGKRNYRNFFLFVMVNTALVLFSMFISLYRMLSTWKEENADDFGSFLKKEPYTIISAVYCLMFSLFLGPLFIFHVWLVKNNLTTNEFWKKTWKKMGVNPYKKKNFTSNCIAIMCLPMRASFIQLKKVVYPNRIPHKEHGTDSFAKVELGNQVTAEGDRAIVHGSSPEPFIQRKESDKSNTAEEHDVGVNNYYNNKTPPSSAGTHIGEADMFNSHGLAKKVAVRTINTNNFVHNMDGAPIEIVARSSHHNDTKTPIKMNLDLDNEKSPLSVYVDADTTKNLNYKRKHSGSIYDSPEIYSRNNSGRRIVQEV